MNWSVLIAFLGGLSGSIITLVGNIITTKLNHKHELEKAKQTQILDMGYKDYEMKKKEDNHGEILTLEMHLFFHKRFIEFLEKENISQDDISNFLEDMEQYRFEFEQHYKAYGSR